MPEFNDELEREFGARFGALHGSVAAAVPMPDAEEIAARGRRRRRNGQAVLAGFAVLAVTTAGLIALGPLRPGQSPRPNELYSGSTTTTPEYAPPAGAGRDPVGLSIPLGFPPAEDPRDVNQGYAAVPGPMCDGVTALIRVRDGLIAGRSTRLAGQIGTYRLLVYPTGTLAGAAFAELATEANRCAQVTDDGLTWHKQIDVLGLGAQSIRVTTRYTKNTKGGLPPTEILMVVRWGGAVLLVQGPDETPVQRNAELFERRLCVFARDCSARDGRPAAVPDLSAGGTAWAAVLAVEPDRTAVELGRAVAGASEMGYRTSVASVDCDQDARAGLGLPLYSTDSYVAVYFARKADAEEFVAKATVPTIAVVRVHTYCIG